MKSQAAVPADPRDPELARMPADELASLRARVQAGWLAAIANDTMLQEELAADDLARVVVCHSRAPGGPLSIATTLFLIQLNLFALNNVDVLICGYQGGDYQQIHAREPLLRSEYASVDLVYLLTSSAGAERNRLHQHLGEVGARHKELFRSALYEHVIPRLSLLDTKRPSRSVAVPLTQAKRERQAKLDELLAW